MGPGDPVTRSCRGPKGLGEVSCDELFTLGKHIEYSYLLNIGDEQYNYLMNPPYRSVDPRK